MARDANGIYSLPYNWNQDKIDNIKVMASRMQGQDQDIANALTQSISADGSTTIIANIDFNNFKPVNIANATSPQDAATAFQVQNGGLQYFGTSSTLSGGTDGEDYLVTPNFTLAVYPDYIEFTFKSHYTSIINPMIQLGILAQKNIVKSNGASGYMNCVAGDIVAGKDYKIIYDVNISTTQAILVNPEFIVVNTNVINATTATITTANITYPVSAAFNSQVPVLQNNGIDPNNKIDVVTGALFQAGNNRLLVVPNITKTKSNWVAGNLQGGLDTGTFASNTWYHVWGIFDPANNVVDVIYGANSSGPALPSGWQLIARIGCFRSDSGTNIVSGTWGRDGTFVYSPPEVVYAGAKYAGVIYAGCPTGVNCEVNLMVWFQTSIGFSQSVRLNIYGNLNAPSSLPAYPDLCYRISSILYQGVVKVYTSLGEAAVLHYDTTNIITNQAIGTMSYKILSMN